MFRKRIGKVIADGKKSYAEKLDEISLTDDVLYDQYGENIYDTSKKLHKTAKKWEQMILAALVS
ncbi:hypothetical protein [Enterococcus faecium]|uniref:hypothetical protein n=1 Tax=Enterococcus faecium TaxID=1352 RepID=UPI001F507A2A|nr:hypothetical protein [Enterococcus faecium]